MIHTTIRRWELCFEEDNFSDIRKNVLIISHHDTEEKMCARTGSTRKITSFPLCCQVFVSPHSPFALKYNRLSSLTWQQFPIWRSTHHITVLIITSKPPLPPPPPLPLEMLATPHGMRSFYQNIRQNISLCIHSPLCVACAGKGTLVVQNMLWHDFNLWKIRMLASTTT